VIEYNKHIIPLSGDSSLVLYSLCIIPKSGFTFINHNLFEVRGQFINFSIRSKLPGLEERFSFDSSELVLINSYFKTYVDQNTARLYDEVKKTMDIFYLNRDEFKREFKRVF
jgi:hypothetical protein